MWPSPPHFFLPLSLLVLLRSTSRAFSTPVTFRYSRLPLPMKVWSGVQPLPCDIFYWVTESAGSSVREYPDWSAACERRFGSERNRERGKVRRRRGRRLLIMRQLLFLLSRLLCGLLRCCFLRCHENSTPLRCQNVSRCMCGIAEFVRRVKFSFLDFSGRSDSTDKESPASLALTIGYTP